MKTFIYGCKPWSREDDSILLELHNDNCKLYEIGRILNRTVAAIKHRKQKLGLTRVLKMDARNIVRRRRKMKEKN